MWQIHINVSYVIYVCLMWSLRDIYMWMRRVRLFRQIHVSASYIIHYVTNTYKCVICNLRMHAVYCMWYLPMNESCVIMWQIYINASCVLHVWSMWYLRIDYVANTYEWVVRMNESYGIYMNDTNELLHPPCASVPCICVSRYCNTLSRTVTRCNTMQHAATRDINELPHPPGASVPQIVTVTYEWDVCDSRTNNVGIHVWTTRISQLILHVLLCRAFAWADTATLRCALQHTTTRCNTQYKWDGSPSLCLRVVYLCTATLCCTL